MYDILVFHPENQMTFALASCVYTQWRENKSPWSAHERKRQIKLNVSHRKVEVQTKASALVL